MGSVSFIVPDSVPPDARRCLDRACLAGGYDVTPVPTARILDGDRLTLTKDANESGYLMVPWPVAGFGTPVTLSATLRERVEPYHLLVEMVRGKLNHLRNQTAEWEGIGLSLEPDILTAIADATHRFGAVVADPTTPAAVAEAQAVLQQAYRLADRVTREFTAQLLATRLSENGRLLTRLGCRVSAPPGTGGPAAFTGQFNAVRVVPDWASVEATESNYDWSGLDALVDWACGAGLSVSLGPLIDLAHGPFPRWLHQADGDLPGVAAYVCDFAETVVHRYRDRVRTWQAFAGFNHADALGLGEDDRLRLAARLLESVRQADPDAELVIGIAQPWGDYLTSEHRSYSPIVFADTLMRAGFSFAALELELLTGPGDRAGARRDLLDTFRVLDLFGVLGIPLEVVVGESRTDKSPATAGAVVELATALPHVRGVYWEAWDDGPAARLPACAVRSAGADLPQVFRALRSQYLNGVVSPRPKS